MEKKVYKFRRETFSFTSSKKHSFIFREKEKKNENLSSRSNCMKFEERQKKNHPKWLRKEKTFWFQIFYFFDDEKWVESTHGDEWEGVVDGLDFDMRE